MGGVQLRHLLDRVQQVQQVGAQAVQTAFSLFGQVAMRELMISPEVSAAMPIPAVSRRITV